VVAGWLAWRAHRRERRRDAIRAEESRQKDYEHLQEQASKVVVWAKRANDVAPSREGVETTWNVYAKNFSELPVTDLLVKCWVRDKDDHVSYRDLSERRVEWAEPDHQVKILVKAKLLDSESLLVHLRFADSSGVRWRRSNEQLWLDKFQEQPLHVARFLDPSTRRFHSSLRRNREAADALDKVLSIFKRETIHYRSTPWGSTRVYPTKDGFTANRPRRRDEL